MSRQVKPGGYHFSLLTNEAHAIEDGGIEHERHGVGVQRLPAEGPHIWAIRKIQLCWHHRCPWLVLLQDLLQCIRNFKGPCCAISGCLRRPYTKEVHSSPTKGSTGLTQT